MIVSAKVRRFTTEQEAIVDKGVVTIDCHCNGTFTVVAARVSDGRREQSWVWLARSGFKGKIWCLHSEKPWFCGFLQRVACLQHNLANHTRVPLEGSRNTTSRTRHDGALIILVARKL